MMTRIAHRQFAVDVCRAPGRTSIVYIAALGVRRT